MEIYVKLQCQIVVLVFQQNQFTYTKLFLELSIPVIYLQCAMQLFENRCLRLPSTPTLNSQRTTYSSI